MSQKYHADQETAGIFSLSQLQAAIYNFSSFSTCGKLSATGNWDSDLSETQLLQEWVREVTQTKKPLDFFFNILHASWDMELFQLFHLWKDYPYYGKVRRWPVRNTVIWWVSVRNHADQHTVGIISISFSRADIYNFSSFSNYGKVPSAKGWICRRVETIGLHQRRMSLSRPSLGSHKEQETEDSLSISTLYADISLLKNYRGIPW